MHALSCSDYSSQGKVDLASAFAGASAGPDDAPMPKPQIVQLSLGCTTYTPDLTHVHSPPHDHGSASTVLCMLILGWFTASSQGICRYDSVKSPQKRFN